MSQISTYHTTEEIRFKFAKFFEKHGHLKIKSSSLIPHNDKTLMFCNAGKIILLVKKWPKTKELSQYKNACELGENTTI